MKKRSKFSLSHYRLLTCDMGELIPAGLIEVLPGDTFQQASSALIRVSPLLAPVMHPVVVRIHHWFVPHRLVWDDWEKFITGGPDGMDASVFPTITLSYTGPAPGTGSGRLGGLADYLGCPTGVNGLEVSALPFRGYSMIFNEWYRDQDLVTPLTIDLTSGADTTTNTNIQNCAWEKDYYTSARPWSLKGPNVTVPLGGEANVIGLGINPTTVAGVASGATFKESGNLAGRAYTNSLGGAAWANNIGLEMSTATASAIPRVRADLSTGGIVDINDLRLAFALQRYEEARARYGSRYTEYLRYLGVRSSDARLQRPEYLGGGKQTIQFSEVLQTSPTTNGSDTVGVGNLKGHGISAVRSNRYRRFFEEHGYIFSFFSVRPKTIYVQGLQRTWNRRVKEDFWQRELEHIGQQEVLRKEVYGASPTPNAVFGYQDRYDEYRRSESWVSAEFRDAGLDYWHMARIFGSEPSLNASFVQSNPTKRNYAVATTDSLLCMVNHNVQARRMLSRTGNSFIF